MKDFIKRFNSKVHKPVREIYKRGPAYLVVASDGPTEMDPFYITDERCSEIAGFIPTMDLDLYSDFMKNKIYG